MRYLFFVIVIVLSAGSAMAWQEITVDGFVLRWETATGENLSVELSAPTTGWVAVGFNPTQMMLNANIIIGYIASDSLDADSLYIRDDFGWQTTSHRDDTLLGGTSDVTGNTWMQAPGTTGFVFTIPLNSGDVYDRQLVPGNTYPIILARSADGEDNFTAPHAAFATASITIEALALEPYTWAAIKTSMLTD